MPPNSYLSNRIKLIIIGGGITGYSLAHEAAKLEIESIVLDNGQPGTTHAATGILDARADHLTRDLDSVVETAKQIIEWQNGFPYQSWIIKPKRFLLPIGPLTPHGSFLFDSLFKIYEKVARLRINQLPDKHCIISSSLLERMEPNLRRGGYFDSAVLFWLWTTDPDALLKKVHDEAVIMSSFSRRLPIKKIAGFTINNSYIESISIENNSGKIIKISHSGPLVIINTTGPWIEETLKDLGIKFGTELKLGIQAKFLGHYFQSDSGLITFGEDGKYIICLQEKGYLQVGPTNNSFQGLPNNPGTAENDLNCLRKTLTYTLEKGYPLPSPQILKHGWRIKPKYFIDPDRPVILDSRQDGIENLYTAVPGKMALGLLTARELLMRLAHDGWLRKTMPVPKTNLSLDGGRIGRNRLKLLWFYLKSNFILGWHFIIITINRILGLGIGNENPALSKTGKKERG